ncbi:MAG TPA: CDP-glycerol glycerophosphotransferase family protein [Micropruina sp.]|nr:CDP-glycerol glycerophosphotransferase family protein [Micropruina sp.]
MGFDSAVETIAWERVHLTIVTKLTQTQADAEPAVPPDEVSYRLQSLRFGYPVQTEYLGDGRHRLTLTITDFHDRRPIPDGAWRLIAEHGGEDLSAVRLPLDRVDAMDDYSRVFLYSQNTESYSVTFGITESDVRPEFVIRTYRFYRNPVVADLSSAKRVAGTAARRLKVAASDPRPVGLAIRSLSRMFRRVFGSPGNRILFASEMRGKLEGNLLRVRDRMLERGLDGQFEFTYSFRLPSSSSTLGTLGLIRKLATADIILVDDYFGLLENLYLDPKVKVIQLWHAGSGFKSIGYSRFGKYGSPKLFNAHRRYTYAIAGSTHLVPVYAEAFGIEERAVVPTGLPRIDTFLDPELSRAAVDAFYAAHPELVGKRIILFAPTFRGRGILDAYYDYDQIDFARWWEQCGDDTVVLFRMHHFVAEPPPIPEQYRDRLIDAAGFGDTNDLLRVADVLITDYSSVIYEYSLLRRPMLFFSYDREVYAATRGFHRDFEETAPGKACDTFDELLTAIAESDFETWRIDAFVEENFDYVDTGSTDRVIDWLILGEPPQPAGPDADRQPAADQEGQA